MALTVLKLCPPVQGRERLEDFQVLALNREAISRRTPMDIDRKDGQVQFRQTPCEFSLGVAAVVVYAVGYDQQCPPWIPRQPHLADRHMNRIQKCRVATGLQTAN